MRAAAGILLATTATGAFGAHETGWTYPYAPSMTPSLELDAGLALRLLAGRSVAEDDGVEGAEARYDLPRPLFASAGLGWRAQDARFSLAVQRAPAEPGEEGSWGLGAAVEIVPDAAFWWSYGLRLEVRYESLALDAEVDLQGRPTRTEPVDWRTLRVGLEMVGYDHLEGEAAVGAFYRRDAVPVAVGFTDASGAFVHTAFDEAFVAHQLGVDARFRYAEAVGTTGTWLIGPHIAFGGWLSAAWLDFDQAVLDAGEAAAGANDVDGEAYWGIGGDLELGIHWGRRWGDAGLPALRFVAGWRLAGGGIVGEEDHDFAHVDPDETNLHLDLWRFEHGPFARMRWEF